jgi:hypothetical protein
MKYFEYNNKDMKYSLRISSDFIKARLHFVQICCLMISNLPQMLFSWVYHNTLEFCNHFSLQSAWSE